MRTRNKVILGGLATGTIISGAAAGLGIALAVRRDQQPTPEASPEEKAYADELAHWLR